MRINVGEDRALYVQSLTAAVEFVTAAVPFFEGETVDLGPQIAQLDQIHPYGYIGMTEVVGALLRLLANERQCEPGDIWQELALQVQSFDKFGPRW